jgi:hypothetical protein
VKVLVACEFSGVVRDAFRAKGHEAWSCDVIAGNSPFHIMDDVRNLLNRDWDLMIAHPPCTYTCVSGNKHYAGTQKRQDGIEFFRLFLEAPIPKICVEHPVSVISTAIRPPDQYIQPWQFGHGETKKTGLWLKNLPKLVPTNVVEGREPKIHKMPPSEDRGYLRSITYQGIADAMAEQWSNNE